MAWHRKNKTRVRAHGIKWLSNNREKHNKTVDRYAKRNPEKKRQRQGMIFVELSIAQMRALQDNKCAVCIEELPEIVVVDHDHLTGLVRKLLCSRCNLALGHFKDDPHIIDRAAAYIRKHEIRS